MFWMYMVRCADESFYVGHTDNLEARLAAHEHGVFASCYTFERRPVKLVFCEAFPTREEALAMERRVKGWSRAKKKALINRDWKEISKLGKARTTQQALRSEQTLRQAHGERSKSGHRRPTLT
jgi:putative endonuclease